MDMFTHLPRWIAYLERYMGRALEEDDCIFPYIAPNGVVNLKREMTHDMVQSLLNEFAENAGLSKVYTTHCLRRGGAQYRFMYAPIGRRWSLSVIRWWGGWAIGEHVRRLSPLMVC